MKIRGVINLQDIFFDFVMLIIDIGSNPSSHQTVLKNCVKDEEQRERNAERRAVSMGTDGS